MSLLTGSRAVSKALQKLNSSVPKHSVRNGGTSWGYRQNDTVNRWSLGVKIQPSPAFKDPRTYTDAELGIPPDEEGLLTEDVEE